MAGNARDRAEHAYQRTVHEAADREAIRSAESLVSDAWIDRLFQAEQDASAAVRMCEGAHEEVSRLFVRAMHGDNFAMTTLLGRDLERVNSILGTRLRAWDRTRKVLASELEEWALATQSRLTEAQYDRDRVTAADARRIRRRRPASEGSAERY